MQSIRKCDRNRDWSSENAKHSKGGFHSRNIGPKRSCGFPGVKNGTFVINFIYKIDHFLEGLFFEILEGARRGEKRWIRTSEIA